MKPAECLTHTPDLLSSVGTLNSRSGCHPPSKVAELTVGDRTFSCSCTEYSNSIFLTLCEGTKPIAVLVNIFNF